MVIWFPELDTENEKPPKLAGTAAGPDQTSQHKHIYSYLTKHRAIPTLQRPPAACTARGRGASNGRPGPRTKAAAVVYSRAESAVTRNGREPGAERDGTGPKPTTPCRRRRTGARRPPAFPASDRRYAIVRAFAPLVCFRLERTNEPEPKAPKSHSVLI
jgi:hypothetical protein